MSYELAPLKRLGELEIDEYAHLVREGLLWGGTPEIAFGVSLYLERVSRACGGTRIGEIIEAIANGIVAPHEPSAGAHHDPLVTVAARLGQRRGPFRGDADATYETLERTLSIPLDPLQIALVRPS